METLETLRLAAQRAQLKRGELLLTWLKVRKEAKHDKRAGEK